VCGRWCIFRRVQWSCGACCLDRLDVKVCAVCAKPVGGQGFVACLCVFEYKRLCGVWLFWGCAGG